MYCYNGEIQLYIIALSAEYNDSINLFFLILKEDNKRNTNQPLIFHDKHANPNRIIVAFRGTGPIDADIWCTNFDISWHSVPQMGKVHSGFTKAMGLQENETWPKHIDIDENPECHESIKEKSSSL